MKISKETREKELTDYIGKATADREQIIHSYTSYGQQLTTEIEKLTSEVNANKMENHRLQVGSPNYGYISEVINHDTTLQSMLNSNSVCKGFSLAIRTVAHDEFNNSPQAQPKFDFKV